MSWTLFSVVALIVVLSIGLKVFDSRRSILSLSYRKLEKFLSPAERSFFGVLTSAVGGDLLVFAKVRVADVLVPSKGLGKANWQRTFNKISAKHFDFILCNKDDLSAVCAIELDDKSHNSAKIKDRDQFLNEACESAGFPLRRFKVKTGYTRTEIQEFLKDFIPEEKASIGALEVNPQSCPKCNSELVKRVAKKGKNAGKEFMACSSYPSCRYVLNIG